MIAGLAYTVCALDLVSMGWGLVTAVLDKPPGKAQLLFAAFVWLATLAQSAIALVRVATGSATVATVTAAGLLTPIAATLPQTDVALMVLAIGSGSLFLSHVNDAGFWLVKQYLGTSVGQTFKTWSVMECLISVTGLLGVLLLSAIL